MAIQHSALSFSDDDWRRRVADTRRAIGEGLFDKAVLACRMDAELSAPVSIGNAMHRLGRNYPDCHVLTLPHGKGCVVAATPEPLALKQGDRISAHALAGTVARGAHSLDDARSASVLRASSKERREHQLVVDAVRSRLAGLCRKVEPVDEPGVRTLRFVQHLWTEVRGVLHDAVDLLQVAQQLHPTPAVLGSPQAAARDWLARCSLQRDGLYTGVAGWIDRQGDGEAVVLLRSAWLEDRRAVLWAGAGIMAESDPDAEFNEIRLKFKTMLEILGGVS